METQQMEPYPLPTGAAPHQTEGALHYQIDPTEILEELEHALKAEVLVYDENLKNYRWITPPGMNPIINERGVNAVMMMLKARLTKIFILSDLETEQIEKMTYHIGQNVIDLIYYNWDQFGIKDDAQASSVLHLVTDTVYSTLRKSYHGNYLKFLRTTQSIQEVQHHSIQQQGKPQGQGNDGVLGRLFGRRR